MQSMSISERVLATVGILLIGTICVATDRLPKPAARLIVGAIRLFGRLVDSFPVHLIYSGSTRPAQPSDSGVRHIRHV
jgi:hypothetical protein